jgi:hypothetical protein
MITYAADFTGPTQGFELTDDDLLANRAGLLSPAHRRVLERERRDFLAAAAVAAILTAIAVLELSLGRLGSATLILLGVGVTTLFLLLARENHCALHTVFPSVSCVQGAAEIRETSGFSQEIAVGNRGFLIAPHLAKRLQPGESYELHFVAETGMLLGWRKYVGQSSANRISTCA